MLRIKNNFSKILSSHTYSPTNTDSTHFEFTNENYDLINQVIAKYPVKNSAIMPLLWIAQEQNNNFLSLSAMHKVAKILSVEPMQVYEVASFYTMYNRQPVNKFHLQVCGTTSCKLMGSDQITESINDFINKTSNQKLYTVQEVECLGACSNAPMIQVNNKEFYEDLTPDNVQQLLQDLIDNKAKPGPQIKRNFAEGQHGRTTLLKVKNKLHNRDFKKDIQKWKQNKEQQQKK